MHEFLRLAVATGGHYRYRWNEQGVHSMVWQMFVPKNRTLWLDFSFGHKREIVFACEDLRQPSWDQEWVEGRR